MSGFDLDLFLKNISHASNLDNSEVMIVWSIRHWINAPKNGENPRELFRLSCEQQGVKDFSLLLDEISYCFKEATTDKSFIGGEFCNHLHLGELLILQSLFHIQNNDLNKASTVFERIFPIIWAKRIFKILCTVSHFMEMADLRLPYRKEYTSEKFH